MPVLTLDSLRQRATLFLSQQVPGLEVLSMWSENGEQRMAQDVEEGLGHEIKSIPSTYFYDQIGSKIYEKITALPEYYQTRTEAALLKAIVPELRETVGVVQMVELGSGSCAKTRALLDAWQADTEFLTFVPIDVSESMLSDSARQLTREYRQLQVLGLAGQYEEALAVLPPDEHRLVLFLGGTIGNFSSKFQTEFFGKLRKLMLPGTKFLLGFDRQPHANKPVDVIYRAYNDAQGVTAAFNLNILAHLNRVLEADFDLNAWGHRAIYNETAQQIEMYLESLRHQVVKIKSLDTVYEFETGDQILTEISRKFDPDGLARWFQEAGFRTLRHWSDPAEYFGLLLMETI